MVVETLFGVKEQTGDGVYIETGCKVDIVAAFPVNVQTHCRVEEMLGLGVVEEAGGAVHDKAGLRVNLGRDFRCRGGSGQKAHNGGLLGHRGRLGSGAEEGEYGLQQIGLGSGCHRGNNCRRHGRRQGEYGLGSAVHLRCLVAAGSIWDRLHRQRGGDYRGLGSGIVVIAVVHVGVVCPLGCQCRLGHILASGGVCGGCHAKLDGRQGSRGAGGHMGRRHRGGGGLNGGLCLGRLSGRAGCFVCGNAAFVNRVGCALSGHCQHAACCGDNHRDACRSGDKIFDLS